MPDEEDQIENAIRAATNELRDARQLSGDSNDARLRLVTALESLATSQAHLGDFEKAQSLYREAIETGEKSGAPASQMASLRSGLATLFDFNNREDDAVPLYERAIEDLEKIQPSSGEDVARLRNNVAMIYKKMARYALAEQHCLLALESLEKIQDGNKPLVAAVYNNLGSIYQAAERGDLAKEMHHVALELRSESLGAEHPDVAQSYSNLAATCYTLQDDASAMAHFEKCLDILEKNLDTSADKFEHTATDYISLLESIGETKKAEAVRRRMEDALGAIRAIQ